MNDLYRILDLNLDGGSVALTLPGDGSKLTGLATIIGVRHTAKIEQGRKVTKLERSSRQSHLITDRRSSPIRLKSELEGKKKGNEY
jgi:hypothetical protein